MSDKKKKKKKTGSQRMWGFLKFQMVLILLVLAAVAYYYAGGYAAKVASMKREAVHLVSKSDDDTFRSSQTSIVYDANGATISVLKGEKDVYYLELADIPIYAQQAIISTEDKKFYSHHGVDFKAILRAAWAMVRNGKVTQGGSTITQQLARNVFLNQDRTWERKIEEIYIATELEKKYSKEKILEYYLNNVYFANGYYGIGAACRGYFNKEAGELTLSEIAYLCAIPGNPTYFDPIEHGEHTLERRDRILKYMLDDKLISEKSYQTALAQEIVFNRPQQIKNNYAETYTYYCATRALMSLEGFEFQTQFDSAAEEKAYRLRYNELYDTCNERLFTGGYRIYTSLDLNAQAMLQEAVDRQLEQFTEVSEEGVYALQSAAVCIDNTTGMVRAIVGGRSQDFAGYTLNRAYQSFRQPGSTIKPLIVYTPALERGYTADSIVVDEPIEGGPSNAGGGYSGAMTLRSAVQWSKNTIAWKIFEELTPAVGISYLKEMNFSKLSPRDETQAAALGGFTNGVSPLEMAKGYATIADDGNYREPTCIIKITDAWGNSIYQSQQVETVIYKESAARAMTDILQTVIASGTARGLSLGDMPCAGKTGTTNSNYDGWFVGYTPYYTTSVWVGYDQPREVPGLTGASYPGNIWHDFMLRMHQDLPVIDFLTPVAYVGEGETDDMEEEQ